MIRPPTGQSCASCKFLIGTWCRYGPPQAWAGDPRIGGSPQAIWPPVKPEDWCGQYVAGGIETGA